MSPSSIHISKRDGCIRTRRKLDVQPPLHQIPACVLRLLSHYKSPEFRTIDKAKQRDIRMRLRRYHLIPAPAAAQPPLLP